MFVWFALFFLFIGLFSESRVFALKKGGGSEREKKERLTHTFIIFIYYIMHVYPHFT